MEYLKNNAPVDLSRVEKEIELLVREERLRDTAIVENLIPKGYEIAAHTVGRVRQAIGLKFRLSIQEKLDEYDQLQELVQKELDNGSIEDMGRTMVTAYFANKGFIIAE